MTSEKCQDPQRKRAGLIARLSHFERAALGGLGGIVTAGILAAAVFPPPGAVQAPRPTLDLESTLRLEPVPTVAVSVAPLRAPIEENGLTVDEVAQTLRYDLDTVADGDAAVPRVFLASMPHDLDDVAEVKRKKAVFFKSVLPLVLQVNEQLSRDRERLMSLAAQRKAGKQIKAEDRLWAAMMSKRYNTERNDFESLLRRVDVIPPSLALAQAAKESGWGTSRFARQGNALFGQWTWSAEDGIEPKQRAEGETHLVREFDTLMDSVEAYMRNLNTHPAYRELRSLRAGMRKRGEPLDGQKLALGLKRYSELGMEYVERIRTMISYNQLTSLDRAKLASTPQS